MSKKNPELSKELSQYSFESLEALQDIVVEMMSQKDLGDTLKYIVNKAMKLLKADAASLYIKNSESDTLVFEVAMNKSIKVKFEKMSIPLEDKGIANYVFKNGFTLNIDNARELKNKEYTFNDSFDKNFGYITKSILSIPLISKKKKALGVIQVINRKNSFEEAWPLDDKNKIHKMPNFSNYDVNLLESFSKVASSVIENNFLYSEIEQLLEGFVKASVTAIESRDPTTSGHSERVAALTVSLAENCSRSQDFHLKHISYSHQQIAELRYASLLHDFGKIAVKESTLLKEEKLSPLQKIEINYRFRDFKLSAERETLYAYIHKLLKENRPPNDIEWKKIRNEIEKFGLQIEEAWSLVQELNRPTILNEDQSLKLKNISHLHCKDCEGKSIPLLKTDEINRLSIQRGSLTDDERKEIESHVNHTVQFLKRIPWTHKFKDIVDIAGAHHEKLNGKGYPNRLTADQIPDQAKMMTICDIFDALVANDRPYKKALPLEKALDILHMQVKSGELDSRFLQIFTEAKCWENPQFKAFMKGEIKKVA